MALAREDISYERIPCTRDGLPDEPGILRALDRPDIKVLAISWVSFATGYAVDLERMGRACRERGIYFVVDAIQGVGVQPIDAHACHIDVLACGGQKWLLSPWGTGFAFIRRDLAQTLEPREIGWLAVRGSRDFNRLVDYDLSWYEDARRFEVGTLPYQDLAAFCVSLELLLEIGIESISAQVSALADAMLTRLADAGATIVTPSDRRHRAGIVTVRVSNGERISNELARAGIVCSLREGAIRISPHFYNTREEVERAINVIVSGLG
jgi:selenocysteine lyase/cysteine desulfurase